MKDEQDGFVDAGELLNGAARVFTLPHGRGDLKADGHSVAAESDNLFAQIELQRAARLMKLPPHKRVAGQPDETAGRFARSRQQ